MAGFFGRRRLISMFVRVVVIVLLMEFILFLLKKIVFHHDENLGFILLNETSSDYQFITTHFASASEGSWQNISETYEIETVRVEGSKQREEKNISRRLLAFSAHLDERFDRKMVTIIAAINTQMKYRKNVWCKFWYRETDGDNTIYYMRTVQAHYKIISENWGLPYSAYFLNCPLDDDLPVPAATSLVTEISKTPQNVFRVLVNEKPAEWSLYNLSTELKNIAVCVKPLHYDYNRVMELIEFIELHRTMGVNHFFFYNHTIGSQVNCLLENYVKEQIVTIFPWKLPLKSQEEIRTEGIFAALNDCLYRTMHVYSHVLFVDFDEYIIPRNHYTYQDFFNYLNKGKNMEKMASFNFRNAFFYRQWPDDREIDTTDPFVTSLITLKKTTRRTFLHPYRIRSKYIARPELVNMVGNHFIWEYANRGFSGMNIDVNDGILHHYRKCEFGGDDCVKENSVVDKSAHKYKNDLLWAVKNRFEKHRYECSFDGVLTQDKNK